MNRDGLFTILADFLFVCMRFCVREMAEQGLEGNQPVDLSKHPSQGLFQQYNSTFFFDLQQP